MVRYYPRTILIGALFASITVTASADVYKCTVAGAVTFQNAPCPVGKNQRQERVDPAAKVGHDRRGKGTAAAPSPASSGFTCDGRRYCTQMTSCKEAGFFLSHCPGTQMDGDHDGIPCEQQWCNHP